MSLPVTAPVQELSASGNSEGAVRPGKSGTTTHGRDHQAVPNVGQTAAPGGFTGQGGIV